MGRLARWCDIEGITGFSVSYTSLTAHVHPTKSEIESKIKSGYVSNISSSHPSGACVPLDEVSATMSIGQVKYQPTDQTTSNIVSGILVYYNGDITSMSQYTNLSSGSSAVGTASASYGEITCTLNSGIQWQSNGYYYFVMAPSGIWMYRFQLTSSDLNALNGGLQNVIKSGSKYKDVSYG